MKTLSKKTSHLRAHTWRDIGGLGGLFLDLLFFAFLLIMSLTFVMIGFVTVALDYLLSPLVSLLSCFHRTHAVDMEELDDASVEKLVDHPLASPGAVKP